MCQLRNIRRNHAARRPPSLSPGGLLEIDMVSTAGVDYTSIFRYAIR